MNIQFYLEIEIRYNLPEMDEEDDDGVSRYREKIFHSELFNTKQECVDFGNKFISANTWIEQFPGYVGDRLSTRFDIVACRLKNGTYISMKIKKKHTGDLESLNAELRKFNVDKIEGEIA